MSGVPNNLQSSRNRSAPNLQDNIPGQPVSTSYSAQSGAPPPVFQRSGSSQGPNNVPGIFYLPNMPGTPGSRNSTMANVPSSGLQQPSGNLSSGRFTSNIPVALSQISHDNSRSHPGLANRGGILFVRNPGFSSGTNAVGGTIPGMRPTSTEIGNRNSISGVGVSPMLGNSSPRIATSVGNIIGGGNIGRNINTRGVLSIPGPSSRVNLNTNSGSGNVGLQGSNSLMGGMLQQASPHVRPMLRNSYSGGSLSQNLVNSLHTTVAMMTDLSSRPSSSSVPQEQIGLVRTQGLVVTPIENQNQEFCLQNEDFPPLPGFKGGNSEFGKDLHQKEQLHDNNISMMQSPHFSMVRSSGYNLRGTFSSHLQQQQSNNVPFSHANSQDTQSSHSSHHSHASVPPVDAGLRPPSSQNPVSQTSSSNQPNQPLNPPQQNQHQSSRDQGTNPSSTGQTDSNPFGLLGLLNIIKKDDPDLKSLALGMDLTTLGLNVSAAEDLHKTFASPWSDEPVKEDPDFTVPKCYYALQPPELNPLYFAKLQLNTLFYIFYSMPRDEAQSYAANELRTRGWFFHKERRLWLMRASDVEPVITNVYEQGSFIFFDPDTWETVRKDNLTIYYDKLETPPPATAAAAAVPQSQR